jgi:tRNA (guanine-N7-)-methyltransferase
MKPEFVEHVAQRRAALRAAAVARLRPDDAIVFEIGCGHGHFLARYAHEFPGRVCMGVDVIGERITRAQKKATRAKLANCHFIRGEARELIDALPPGVTFAEIWVLFPDPWPKKRHHKNRILQPAFFEFLAPRTGEGAKLYFRTDHAEYFRAVIDFLPELKGWRADPAAVWPLEQETVFQARAPSYQSVVVVRADPARPATAPVRPPSGQASPTSAG